jgi:two-component system phosphate regulon sensor histidine kinase PhoR
VPAKRLSTRIGRTIAILFVVTVATSAVVLLVGFRSLLIRVHASQLEEYLDTMEPAFIAAASTDSAQAQETIQQLCVRWDQQIDRRLTFVLPDGSVAGESELDPEVLDNHGRRPEIVEATQRGVGTSVRYSDTVQQRMIYVALALRSDDRFLGVLRTAIPVNQATSSLGSFWIATAPVLLFMMGLGIVAVFLTSRELGQVFREINEDAKQFQRDGFNFSLRIPQWREVQGIVELVNSMGKQLKERITSASRQQTLETAILASMVEGVLAIDPGMRIINMNEAAARLLRVSREDALNCRIEEVVRVSAILEFIQKTMESSSAIEEDLLIYDEKERFFKAHGTKLLDSEGQSIGALVALYDNTKIRRLELIRKEFAANVSHELKTPITSIKGFAETLLDSGLDDRTDAMRFLSIITQQSDRLIAIVDDLLGLARIEEDIEREGVALNIGRLRGVIDSAVSTCARSAAEKKINVEVDCPYEATARYNPQLFEQALVNLIDNAIKYSDPGSSILISVEIRDSQVRVSVKDNGCGIAREHIPRLFERFYRVDKTRSRALGGTGLGLAIVKHIVLSHKGTVEVDSEVGAGSTFTICLPEPRELGMQF